jgi:hypothetical protein
MPTYSYICHKDRGGCGQEWQDFKPIHARRNVMCPNCYSDANENNHYDPETHTYLPRIEIILRNPPQVISDIDHQDGRLGESVEMPGLGPDVRVSSRRELRDQLKRTRDEMWERTQGEHSTIRPFQDDNGKIVMEKVTTKSEGFDVGEIVPMEDKPEIQNDPRDPGFVQQGKPLREVEAELEHELGPAPSPPAKRGRPKGSKDKRPRKRKVLRKVDL